MKYYKYKRKNNIFTADICLVTCATVYPLIKIVCVNYVQSYGEYKLNIVDGYAEEEKWEEITEADLSGKFLKFVRNPFLQIDVMKLIAEENCELVAWI